MRAATIESKLAGLQANPESIPWADRVRMVADLLGSAGRGRALAPDASALARLLAIDSKWEVRKEVADHLHKLGESDFAALAAILTQDDNAYVKSSAERALTRRRKGHTGNLKRVRALDKMEDDLRKLEIRHGTNAANMVRDMAHRLYEGLVGASVHEMRSVVTAMKANIECLERAQDGDYSGTVKKITPRMRKSVTFLNRLLDDMRDYTRAPSRERGTERLADLYHEAREMVANEFASAGRDASPISIESDIPGDLVASVSRIQIVLTLRNILKNAHDAFILDEVSFKAGAIRVTAHGDADGVAIRIEDNGMGMDPDELESVLQFIPGRSSKANLGTGYGLPIARRNIRAHGGDLRIESALNVGTRVTVWLPLDGRAGE